MTASLRVVTSLNDPCWDKITSPKSEAGFFHSTAWGKVLHQTYNYTPNYIVNGAFSGDRGVLPLMEVDSWMTGRRGVALPFTDDCEPLCETPEEFDRLLEFLKTHARSRRWKYFELRGGRRWLPSARASQCFYRHELSLESGIADLFARCDSATRRAVRKAEQSELTVEITSAPAAMLSFYSLLCKTRRRQGVPPQPWDFFREIDEHVMATGRGSIILARYAGTPIAGALFFQHGTDVLYKFGASDETFQKHRANNLVMWEGIKSYALQGFRKLDFGRTSLHNPGLRRFKQSWGTTEKHHEYFKYSVDTDRFIADRDRSSGWHEFFFRHLPLSFSRALGSALYKHIA